MRIRLGVVLLIASAHLAGCGGAKGGGGDSCPPSAAPGPHNVTLTWAPNREKGVNSTGGGYHVSISGQPTIDVTFNGATTPTSTTTILQSGCYTATVTAFAAMDAAGGLTGSVSAPSQVLAVNVP